jgi:stage II sporulation protein D
MQKSSIIITLFLIFAWSISIAQNIRVGLFSKHIVTDIQISIQNGEYLLKIDSLIIDTLKSGENLSLRLINRRVQCQIDDSVYSGDSVFYLISKNEKTSFFINHNNSNSKARCYEENLRVTLINDKLIPVNIINLEKYVAAVVEAEAGYNNPIEYYKSQAIICRTYAVSHLNRHNTEGFDLCDKVHCQVYPYKSMTKEIRDAAFATEDLILVDSAYKPILATYHSNSGGQTASSENVWVSSVSYLKSIVDSSSLHGRNSTWQKEISLKEWKNFLEQYEVNQDLPDSLYLIIEPTREKTVFINNIAVPLSKIRTHFHLRSAFFHTTLEGENIFIHGRGYGHGVGLSQEGAMFLAHQGSTFDKILKFYYKGVHIVKLQTVNAIQNSFK